MSTVKYAVALGLVGAVVLAPTACGLLNSFGNRCSEAGFRGATHEACISRLANGGTVYLENMEVKP